MPEVCHTIYSSYLRSSEIEFYYGYNHKHHACG